MQLRQGGRAMNTSSVTLQGGMFHFLVPGINGSFEGKLMRGRKLCWDVDAGGGVNAPLPPQR